MKIADFFKTSFLGGAVVILPIVVFIFLVKWLFGTITNVIQPLTNLMLKTFSLPEIAADVLVLAVILLIFFLVGLFVRTKLGNWIFQSLENDLFKKIPGYKLIRETIAQFFSNEKSLFSTVALVQVFENDTLITGFVTEEHDNGMKTVFVPTGPNPTSGFIYHVKSEYVHPIDVSVEDAMRSVISCGNGSGQLIKQLKK